VNGEYLVCKFRTGGLFIQTRTQRETMISVLVDMKMPVTSMVLKTFDSGEAAEKYKSEIELVDTALNSIL
jgi:hypothetical protein